MGLDKTGGLIADGNVMVSSIKALATPKGRSGMDIDKAIDYLLTHAEEGSVHRCARYVRLAIMEGGGLKLARWPENAKDYGPTLTHHGFMQIPAASCTLIKGDVCVFQPCKGTSAAGHIQMFTGDRWCSDFLQKNKFWPGSHYEKGPASYAIYRP
jgi:hypothetical protein